MATKIIHSVPQVGKTKPVLKMKEAFGIDPVIDGWVPGLDLPEVDTLILTYCEVSELDPYLSMEGIEVLSFSEAVALSSDEE